MNIRTLTAIITFIFLLNLGALFAYMYFRFVQPAHGTRVEMALPDAPERRLRLDRSQRRQLGVIIQRFRRETGPTRAKCDSLTAAVIKLQKMDNAPRAEIDSLFIEIAEVRAELAQILFARLQLASRFLSSDQQDHVYRTLLRSHYDLPPKAFSVDL